jgi:hypothetical protein
LINGQSDRNRTAIFQFTGASDHRTTAHEIGHALFLSHAPGHFRPGANPELYFAPMAHSKNAVCIMSYAVRPTAFCALCLLKLAGCQYWKIRIDGTIKV